MATINEQIAADIIFKNKYHGESKYLIKYHNMFGGISYASINARQDPMMYHQSPACMNAKCIWKHPAFVDHPAGMYTHLQAELEKFK